MTEIERQEFEDAMWDLKQSLRDTKSSILSVISYLTKYKDEEKELTEAVETVSKAVDTTYRLCEAVLNNENKA